MQAAATALRFSAAPAVPAPVSARRNARVGLGCAPRRQRRGVSVVAKQEGGGGKGVPTTNYVVPLDRATGMTRPLVEILRDLNKRVPDKIIDPDTNTVPWACLGLLRSSFFNSAPNLSSQTDPTPRTLLQEKGGVEGLLHVFSGAPQEPELSPPPSAPSDPASSSRIDDAILYIDVVHANAAAGIKPLVGSARLPLRDVLDDAGIGGRASHSLRLKRPSGRPQGRLEVRVAVREAARYYDGPSPYAPPYGQSAGSRDPYAAPPPYGGYDNPYVTLPAGYPAAYGADAPAAAYGSVVEEPQRKSKMGMGTGLAVGAAAGVLGGLALAGGASYLEDKFEEGAAEKVEEDLARDSYGGGGYDDFGGGDDDY